MQCAAISIVLSGFAALETKKQLLVLALGRFPLAQALLLVVLLPIPRRVDWAPSIVLVPRFHITGLS